MNICNNSSPSVWYINLGYELNLSIDRNNGTCRHHTLVQLVCKFSKQQIISLRRLKKKGEGSGNKSMKIRLKIRSVVERLVFTYNLAKEQQLYESIESKLVIAFKHSKERLARELGVFSFNENTVS